MEENVFKIATNYEVCKMCKGKCCEHMPGSYNPADLIRIYGQPITVDLLVQIFETQRVAVDWWEGDPRSTETPGKMHACYYLRPKTVKAVDRLRDPSWGGACVHWSKETGCTLTENERPFGCRMLTPSRDNFPDGCSYDPNSGADKRDIAISWIPYQSHIKEAMEIYDSKYIRN